MSRRRRAFAVLLTTSAAAATIGFNRWIHNHQRDSSSVDDDVNDTNSSNNQTNPHEFSLKVVESKLNLNDSLLKNKGDDPYIQTDTTDELTTSRYNQALQYIKQSHSTNYRIRERGLTHLAKLDHLPPAYYPIIGQQLDQRTAISLARTQEVNSSLFPTGTPYTFPIGEEKVVAIDDVKNVNDDNVLLHTIRHFLEQVTDGQTRSLDILSQHYLDLLNSDLDEIHSQTVFDLVQHFEPEHADMTSKAIQRYRSNLELYSTFLFALRGYADRYPVDVVRCNGLQILKYLYEKRKDNIPFVRFIGKILLLISRDQSTHDAFYAVGWVKILHEMSLDSTNIIYSLLSSTILANLDRPIRNENVITTEVVKSIVAPPTKGSSYLPTEISQSEIADAEEKTEEVKEDVLENQPSKSSTLIDQVLTKVWYSRPVSDEAETPDEIKKLEISDDHVEGKIAAPDIDTSHSEHSLGENVDEDKIDDQKNEITKVAEAKSLATPSWINDQVYGDKVILLSPTWYNIHQLEPDARWHQEPLVDVIFFHGLAGSAFKTWRQESPPTETKPAVPPSDDPTTAMDEQPSSVIDESEDDNNDELLDIKEETNWSNPQGDSTTSDPTKSPAQEHRASSCWPKDWLGEDLPSSHVRLLAVDYESTVSEWQLRSMPRNVVRRPMNDRAQEIAEQLKQAGVGKRPIIWVTHSMGGLLTKYILGNEENAELRSNTRACVFFSVPHFGAELASFGIRHAFLVRPTVEIEELEPNSKNLLSLHERFLDMLKKHDHIKIISFAENEKTTFSLRYQTVVVPAESSQINIGKFSVLNKNHIYICKPNSKDVIEYQELLELIQSVYFEHKQELKTRQTRSTEEFLNNLYVYSSPISDDQQ